MPKALAVALIARDVVHGKPATAAVIAAIVPVQPFTGAAIARLAIDRRTAAGALAIDLQASLVHFRQWMWADVIHGQIRFRPRRLRIPWVCWPISFERLRLLWVALRAANRAFSLPTGRLDRSDRRNFSNVSESSSHILIYSVSASVA